MTRYSLTLSGRVIRRLNDHFLSFTIDTSVLIGGRWWGESRKTSQGLSVDRVPPLELTDPQLTFFAKSLGPCMLRVGGTEADRIRYGFPKEAKEGAEPLLLRPVAEQTPFVLRKRLWNSLADFLDKAGLKLLFTVGAGPECRDARGEWIPLDVIRLISYTSRKKIPVVGWEFGNEVNAFPFIYGLKNGVSGKRYSQEFGEFAAFVKTLHPGALKVGPASAIWPLIGEPHPLIPSLCRGASARDLDVLSFHYYPQQSSRGPVAVRRASAHTLLHARALEGIRRWLAFVRHSQLKGAQGAKIWITELGHALYGGEPGVSDTGLSTPWWLDQLGLLAYEGVDAVFRQSLVGGDYGLLDLKTFQPRPDYYASFFWKKLVGGGMVLEPPRVKGFDRKLRAWLFAGGKESGGVWALLINLHWDKAVVVDLPVAVVRQAVLAPGKHPQWLAVNGVTAETDLVVHWDKPEIKKKYGLEPTGLGARQVHLPALASAFVQVQM